MASLDDHITQWKHNRRCAARIEAGYRDWQLTLVFYTALHAVTAAMAKLGIPCADHSDRNSSVHQNSSFAGLRYAYLDLYRMSKITRYDADPGIWIPKKFVTMQALADELLPPVENTVQTVIGRDLKLGKLTLQV